MNKKTTINTSGEKNLGPTWIMWVLLVAIPPSGIIYMWISQRSFSIKAKKIVTVIAMVWFCILFAAVVSDDNSQNDTDQNSIVTTEQPTTTKFASEQYTTAAEQFASIESTTASESTYVVSDSPSKEQTPTSEANKNITEEKAGAASEKQTEGQTEEQTEPPTEAPTEAQTEPPTEAATEPPTKGEIMVWIDDTGKRYHSGPSCSNMDAPYQVPLSEAERRGYTPCRRKGCW